MPGGWLRAGILLCGASQVPLPEPESQALPKVWEQSWEERSFVPGGSPRERLLPVPVASVARQKGQLSSHPNPSFDRKK